jgi:hypothetical protein
MSKIFISYASQDQDKAEIIANKLMAKGKTVFFSRMIPKGADWAATLEAQLSEATSMIVLWTGHSVKSFWVRSEAAEGLEKQKLIPVLIDNSKLPRLFRGIQTESLQGWDGSSTDKTIDRFLDYLNDTFSLSGFAGLASVPDKQTISPENLTIIHSSWRRSDKDEKYNWRKMYQIHLIIYGRPEVLNRIKSVTYNLHGYPPERVKQKGGERKKNFELKELAWGQSYVRADVLIEDQPEGSENPVRLYQFISLHESGPRLDKFFDQKFK